MTPEPLRLVIFDCDGVLVDSEPASRRVLIAEAARLGWVLTEDQAHGFTGRRFHDLQADFERASGHALPAGWPASIQASLIAILVDNVAPIPDAAFVLQCTTARGFPYRVASNSSHQEMAIKFAATGLAPLVTGRLHSAQDVGIGKPAPDLFLAAAAAEGVSPGACLVVEDSRPGILAAIAAGMACVAYVPHGDPDGLEGLGAWPLRALGLLPPLYDPPLRRCTA
jgi:beta-phosphoglucomutase-like phosphatase (HAD superfamily)